MKLVINFDERFFRQYLAKVEEKQSTAHYQQVAPKTDGRFNLRSIAGRYPPQRDGQLAYRRTLLGGLYLSMRRMINPIRTVLLGGSTPRRIIYLMPEACLGGPYLSFNLSSVVWAIFTSARYLHSTSDYLKKEHKLLHHQLLKSLTPRDPKKYK